MKLRISDGSESEAKESEVSESSETEVSESDVKIPKVGQKKKYALKSDSDSEGESDEEKDAMNESQDTNTTRDSESGWEEIGIGSGEELGSTVNDEVENVVVAQKETQSEGKKKSPTKGRNASPKKKKLSDKAIENEQKLQGDVNKTVEEGGIERDDSAEHKIESDVAGTTDEHNDYVGSPKPSDNSIGNPKETNSYVGNPNEIDSFVGNPKDLDSSAGTIKEQDITVGNTECVVAPVSGTVPLKKKRGRKPKTVTKTVDCDSTTTPEVTPKKRGRKPKPKPEAGDETPVKKKRGRKPKSESAAVVTIDNKELEHNDTTSDNIVSEVNKTDNTTENKDDESLKSEKLVVNIKIENDSSITVEKYKDDSPLSARNKQNAPVGVVKPEVRQGVIVENKQVTDNRLNENRAENPMNPLQGMKELAMGNQNVPGQHQSSFTPYSQSNFANPNMPGFMGPQGFQNYPHPGPPYGQGGPGPNQPYQGPPGMPPGAQPQYSPNQRPISPNSYQQHSSFMGPAQQGPPPAYYQGNYRQPMGRADGFAPPGPHGPQSPTFQQGQYPPNYSPQGLYQGPRPGYPEHPGPYQIGPQGPMPHPQGGHGHYPGMPYSYMPSSHGHQRPSFGPAGPSQSTSPNQIMRPQSRQTGSTNNLPQQRSSPITRVEGPCETPNRGFMMDNILKPSAEVPSNDVEDSADVSDMDRYTSFLCKTPVSE